MDFHCFSDIFEKNWRMERDRKCVTSLERKRESEEEKREKLLCNCERILNSWSLWKSTSRPLKMSPQTDHFQNYIFPNAIERLKEGYNPQQTNIQSRSGKLFWRPFKHPLIKVEKLFGCKKLFHLIRLLRKSGKLVCFSFQYIFIFQSKEDPSERL